MKYENFNKAAEIVEKIRLFENKMESLDDGGLYIAVGTDSDRIDLIFLNSFLNSDEEHPYIEKARELIARIKDATQKKIQELKAEFEKL